MADSLFDHRYRYDYIYPRGRSGETLRAVDTQDGDRPVVIKRPAPNDAPPIRAGQEVSILNERKALTRLAGHPALCALTGTGQFVVGGMAHQYIAIERAEGLIIGDLVLELAGRGDRLPELEMLVIVDALLDLLIAAHSQEIVYNDVDAKHLFWERDQYKLKVIDWGNAVFLEGDETTPQGISRASDIYQVGELLYFIVTGGGRVDVTRDPARAGDDFRLDFGADAERLHSRLAAIISRAAHPNPKLRYRTLSDLRADLSEYTFPIQRDREAVLARISDKLKRDLSKDELGALLRTLEPVLAADPGYPPARSLQREVGLRLTDLDVAADLDAARIYMETANWARAAALFDELRPRARGDTAAQIALLTDWARLMQEADVRRPSGTVREAVEAVFAGDAARATLILQTQGVDDAGARHIQWLLAERVSSHVPEILLLRPNLYRLETALNTLHGEGAPVHEPRALLREIVETLDQIADPNIISLIALRDGFRGVVDRLSALNTMLEALQARSGLPPRKLPMNAIVRALNAAMAVTDNMHIIGRSATNPREANAALDASREIAPGLPVWDGVAHLLHSLYEVIEVHQRFIPAADGSDVAEWLGASAQELAPFTERLFDETLVSMVFGLNAASRSWAAYADAAVQGGRGAALSALQATMDAVSAVSPSLAGWLGQLKTIVGGTGYVERHALHGAIGRVLADGWENFDRGRLIEAERLGLQALEAAMTEAEQFAARRLRDLSEISRDWIERGGASDRVRTEATANAIDSLFTAEETAERESFAAQMPGRETYLKAMPKSLIEHMGRLSTASVRLLYAQYVLLAATAAQTDNERDWRFWRDCAVKTMGEVGLKHPLLRSLTEALERRRDLGTAAETVNAIQAPEALTRIEPVRRTLDDSPQAPAVAPVILSLRELDAAVRDWADGDFRAAALRLENAARAVDETIAKYPDFQPTAYRQYLDELLAGANELHERARKLNQIVAAPPDDVPALARSIHYEWVDATARLIGDGRTAAVRRWRDMYETFAVLYADRTLRRSAKLPRFTELFTVHGIERHPAYGLYRHWQLLTEQSSEFPAPVSADPTPRLADEDEVSAVSASDADAALITDPQPASGTRRAAPRRRANPALLIGALIVALVITGGLGALLLTGSGNRDETAGAALVTDAPTSDATATRAAATRAAAETSIAQIGVTLTVLIAETAVLSPAADTTTDATAEPGLLVLPTQVSATAASAVLATVAPRQAETPAPTFTPSLTLTPSLTFTVTPTATPSATATRPSPTPSNTATPAPTLTPSLPPQGIQGDVDLLAWAAADQAWTENDSVGAFGASADGPFWRLGTGAPIGGADAVVVIAPSAAQFTTRYGSNPDSRLLRTSAQLSLITFNPPLLVDNDVFFGLVLQTASGTASVGIEIQVVQPGIINIAHVVDDTRTVISQRSDSAGDVRLRLERDLVNGEVIAYFNNEAIGERLPLPAEAAVVPALYVHDGGVIVHVFDWTATLR